MLKNWKDLTEEREREGILLQQKCSAGTQLSPVFNDKEFFQFYKFVSWVAGTPFTPTYKRGS